MAIWEIVQVNSRRIDLHNPRNRVYPFLLPPIEKIMKKLLSIVLLFCLACSFIGCEKSKPPKKYETEAECLQRGEPYQKATCLIKLAKMKYEAGATNLSRTLLEKAAISIDEIADPTEKTQLLNQLAEMYGKIGESFGQLNALKKAREAVTSLQEPDVKAKSMIALAKAQMAGKDQMGASETAAKACDLIADNFLPDDKATILLTAADIYHNGGENTKYDAAVNKLREIADALEDRQKMAEIYGLIGKTESKLGLADESKASFDKAFEVVKATDSNEKKGFALVKLAEMQLSLDHKDEAKMLLAEAQKIVAPLTKELSDRGAALDQECEKLKQRM